MSRLVNVPSSNAKRCVQKRQHVAGTVIASNISSRKRVAVDEPVGRPASKIGRQSAQGSQTTIFPVVTHSSSLQRVKVAKKPTSMISRQQRKDRSPRLSHLHLEALVNDVLKSWSLPRNRLQWQADSRDEDRSLRLVKLVHLEGLVKVVAVTCHCSYDMALSLQDRLCYWQLAVALAIWTLFVEHVYFVKFWILKTCFLCL